MMNYGSTHMGWIIACMVAVGVIVTVVAWAILRTPGRYGVQGKALDMLDRRLARGEIDDTEYQRRRQILMRY